MDNAFFCITRYSLLAHYCFGCVAPVTFRSLLLYGHIDNISRCGIPCEHIAHEDVARQIERLFYDDRTLSGTSVWLWVQVWRDACQLRVRAEEATS